MRRLRRYASKKKHICKADNCDEPTTFGKPYCTEHIAQMPYAASLKEKVGDKLVFRGRWGNIKEEVYEVSRGGEITPESSVVKDIINHLGTLGGMRLVDLADSIGLPFTLAALYFDKLEEWGMITRMEHPFLSEKGVEDYVKLTRPSARGLRRYYRRNEDDEDKRPKARGVSSHRYFSKTQAKTVCTSAVLAFFKIDACSYHYSGHLEQRLAILRKNGWAARSRNSHLNRGYRNLKLPKGPKSVGGARKIIAWMNKETPEKNKWDDPPGTRYMLRIARHALLLDYNGETIIDTDPRKRDRRKITDIRAVFPNPQRTNPKQANLFEGEDISISISFDDPEDDRRHEWIVEKYVDGKRDRIDEDDPLSGHRSGRERTRRVRTYSASGLEDAIAAARAMKQESEDRGDTVTIVTIECWHCGKKAKGFGPLLHSLDPTGWGRCPGNPRACEICATALPGAKPGAVCADRTASGLSPSWCRRPVAATFLPHPLGPHQAQGAGVPLLIRPTENWMTPSGSNFSHARCRMSTEKIYVATPATNQPNWEERGAIFVDVDEGGQPPSEGEVFRTLLLSKGEYIIERTERRRNPKQANLFEKDHVRLILTLGYLANQDAAFTFEGHHWKGTLRHTGSVTSCASCASGGGPLTRVDMAKAWLIRIERIGLSRVDWDPDEWVVMYYLNNEYQGYYGGSPDEDDIDTVVSAKEIKREAENLSKELQALGYTVTIERAFAPRDVSALIPSERWRLGQQPFPEECPHDRWMDMCIECKEQDDQRRRNPKQANLFEDRGHVRLSVEPDLDTDEWVVKYYLNDRYKEGPTYYTADLEDALFSATAMKREAENVGYTVTIVIIEHDEFKDALEGVIDAHLSSAELRRLLGEDV